MFQVIWRRNLACLVKELNCCVCCFLCCPEGDRSGRKACHIPLFTLFPTFDALFYALTQLRTAWYDTFHLPACVIPGTIVKKGRMQIFLSSLACYASWVPAPCCNKLEMKPQAFWDLTVVTYCSYWAAPVPCQQGSLGFMSGCVFHSSWVRWHHKCFRGTHK